MKSARVGSILTNFLGDITKNPTVKMHWKHYWRNIVARYHVVIEGWPDNIPFKNLSEVSSSLPSLESLLRKLEAGKIYWKSISAKEFKEIEAARNAGLEAGTVELPSSRRTRSDKGKKRSRYHHRADKEGSDNDPEDGPERPKKRRKKARHHRWVSNDERLSDSDAAEDRAVHDSGVDDESECG